jgi:NifB/MoaA-like Fe-S oxidoreductase
MKGEFEWALEDFKGAAAERAVSIATGYASYDFMKGLADEAMKSVPGLKVNVFRIKNDFFGENITVAGLLTGKDVTEQLSDAAKSGALGGKLLLPRVMLRSEGDLTLDGMTPEQMSEKLGVEIRFVSADGQDLLDALTED